MFQEEVRYLEEVAANAWPAAVVQVIDGWRLRFTWGVSRRANSVWPNRAYGQESMAEKLAWVEEFYRRRHLPARYQICPAAQPADLDDILAARGYTATARTFVQTATIDSLRLHSSPHPVPAVTISETFAERWFTFHCDVEDLHGHKADVRRGILQRIGPPTAYTLAEIEGNVAGIGLGVYERGRLGVFNMLTHPTYRRRGIATAILAKMAEWGAAQGAVQVYLQVMQNNAPALQLYERLGFMTFYRYFYREKNALPHDSLI